MTKEQKKMNKIMALRADWKRNPQFKEVCRAMWDPLFFAQCEEIIFNLDSMDILIRKNLNDGPKTLDIASWQPEEH